MDFFDLDERTRNTASPAETLVAGRYGDSMSVHDLLHLNKLGEGGGGRVSRARHRETAQLLAVKTAHRDFKKTRGAERFVNEVRCMRLAQEHGVPCVAQLVAAFKDADKEEIARNYIIMELYAGDIGDIVLAHDALSFPPSTLRIWTAQLVTAICGLHTIGILHRDLKPENVFLTSQGQIRLGDFGLASIRRPSPSAFRPRRGTFLPGDWKVREAAGTPDYMAPEVLRGKAYGASIDFWGLGIVTFFLHFRHNPFADAQGNVPLARILKHNVAFPHYRKRADALLEDFILALLCKDLRHRLGQQRVMVHPYFTSHQSFPAIDWTSVHNEEFPLPEAVCHRKSVVVLDSGVSLAAACPTPKMDGSDSLFGGAPLPALTGFPMVSSNSLRSAARTMWFNTDDLDDYVVLGIPAVCELADRRRGRTRWSALGRRLMQVVRLRWLHDRVRVLL